MSCGVIATTSLVAHANVEIGATGGVHVFNKQNELGVLDDPNAPSERNSLLLGLRLGLYFNDVIGIEGEFGIIPSVARELEYGITNLTYRAHLIAQFRASNPDNVFIPFVLAGAGAFSVVDSSNDSVMNDPTRNIDEDTDPAFYAGLGAKFRLGDKWGLRLDARLLMVPSSENPDQDPDDDRATTDFEALASVYVEFGRGEKQQTIVEAAPPADDDADRDGIRGAADQCPTDPEDKDAFQDEDGCPEPDNDADGILDASDKCPTDAEDKDGFQDDDGCPDPDNDSDGINDGSDRCPLEAEDKDNFQDDDGCPDPDNDGDGVLDPNDKCTDQPETKNGYQDDDGCPDEIPAKLKKFVGAIQGINFRVNSAELLAVSNRTLDKAVAVLKEFPDLKMEIQGHTDDVLIKKGGKYADNLELSQARAETVREYFIKKGVDQGRLTAKGYGDSLPVESPTGLKGRKLTTARSKNRRVEFQLVSSLTSGTPTPTATPAPVK
ncbi:MAG: OmpA/MotB domain protein [Myxococcales bacterium]|nr:OmpA/MotB domain protein [Myxococcales bacterium]